MTEEIFPITRPVLALVGPTAIGKTSLSIEIAERCNGEIVSVDSMQVYKYMDIGTAKVTDEERGGVPHHLIDIVTPEEPYDAHRFVDDALCAIRGIHGRGKVPLLTGGTGLYLRSLLHGLFSAIGEFDDVRKELQKEADRKGIEKMHEHLSGIDRDSAERIHHNDTHRVLRALEIYYGTGKTWTAHLEDQQSARRDRFVNLLVTGLTCERKKLYDRINERTEMMLSAGLEEEVRSLLQMGYGENLKSMQSIGYRHMICYMNGIYDRTTMKETLARDTRRYAKRQYTWFSKMNIEWFDTRHSTRLLDRLDEFLQ